MDPGVVVPIGGMMMILGIVLGVPLVRGYTRRLETQPRQSLGSGDVVARLDRIEQAIEAIATEVERVAEGQRFTTKLLSEVRSNPATIAPPRPAAAASPAPVMQPDGTVLSEAARRT